MTPSKSTDRDRATASPAKKGLGASKPRTSSAVAPNLADQKALIDQYLPYVRSIAGKIKKSLAKEIEFDDLVEYGMVGLLEAAGRFDPKFGANFMTFSYYRIRGAIYDGLRNMGWVSRNEYAKFRFEERANAYLANVNDRQTIGEDNKAVEAEVEELADTVQNLVTIFVTSLEGMEGLQVEDLEALPVDIKVSDVQVKAHVRDALSRLPEQERNLLTMYYFKEMSLQEVGDSMGLSKSWTSRLHAKAIEKMSRILRDLLMEEE
ncbi:MAG: sigma-70 family RNA polymerase sigma factor [Pseudomonadota bacterium]